MSYCKCKQDLSKTEIYAEVKLGITPKVDEPTVIKRSDVNRLLNCFICEKDAIGGWWFYNRKRHCCRTCLTDELRKEYYEQF